MKKMDQIDIDEPDSSDDESSQSDYMHIWDNGSVQLLSSEPSAEPSTQPQRSSLSAASAAVVIIHAHYYFSW